MQPTTSSSLIPASTKTSGPLNDIPALHCYRLDIKAIVPLFRDPRIKLTFPSFPKILTDSKITVSTWEPLDINASRSGSLFGNNARGGGNANSSKGFGTGGFSSGLFGSSTSSGGLFAIVPIAETRPKVRGFLATPLTAETMPTMGGFSKAFL